MRSSQGGHDGDMTAEPEDQSRSQRVAALFEHNIRTELDAQLGMDELDLAEDLRRQIAWGITAEVLYAFDVDWKPDWVKTGAVHTWQESGLWFSRCGVCLLDSRVSPTREEAAGWA